MTIRDRLAPPTEAGLAALLRGERIEWSAVGLAADDFLAACALHDLTSLVNQRLSGWARDAGWPAALCAELARHARQQTALELVRRHEIASVLERFACAGVQPILIKGTPLAYTIYERPESRPRSDTDIVVARRGVDAARAALASLGYTEPNGCDGELLGQVRFEKRDRLGIQHAFDLHWRISSQSAFAGVLTAEELAARATAVPALGPHARACGPLHALLIACVHPVMHHRNAESLVWMHDVHLLAASLSAEALDEFGDLAIAKGTAAICAQQLSAARARFGTAVPDSLIARLAAVGESETSAAYLRPGRRWHHEFVSNLRGLIGWRDRLRLVREVLLPRPQYMLAASGLSPGRIGLMLVPALYVRRAVHGIWKVLVGRK